MPAPIARLLDQVWFPVFARIILTFVFWGSGLAKLIDFRGGVAEMAAFGFHPPVLFNVLVIITELGGSALVIIDRWTWLGAGALAVFTALTIVLVHHFWTMEGETAMTHFYIATEHVTLIGAMMVVSLLSRQSRRQSPSASEWRQASLVECPAINTKKAAEAAFSRK